MQKLSRDFYNQDTVHVAQELLGKYLILNTGNTQKIGKIVEVEAYLGSHDLACHSSKGLTPRTQVMFGPPGHAYVYMIYGMYFCLNVVTEKSGHGSAILIRAIEPIQHISGKTNGPGLLCRAMGIDKLLNGHDLLSDNFFCAEMKEDVSFKIKKRPRIGVDYAGSWAKKLLRFYIDGHSCVSRR